MTIENPHTHPNPEEDDDYYSFEHDLFKLDKKGNIITDVPTQIRNLIANEPCNMGLDCISLKEFTIKYGIHRILDLERPEQVSYDYFDYKRNKAIVLGPDSPLYILQNMLITKGPHTDPDDPYHNEVLYPELSMDDIDPIMDMRELNHYMRPNSDFYIFIHDPNPDIINLSVRKHRYQIGNTLRTLTMSAGNIFKTKNPKDTESIRSIHDKIKEKKKIITPDDKNAKIPKDSINLNEIPFKFDDKNINEHFKSLRSSENDNFKRNEICGNLVDYATKRSNLNLNLPYFDVYNNILDFAQKTQQFRFSENVQGFYCDESFNILSNVLSKDLSKLKKIFGNLINKEPDAMIKKELKNLFPDDNAIKFLQTFTDWKTDYIKFLNKINSKIGSILTFPSTEKFSIDIYLSKHEKLLYENKKNKKRKKEIEKRKKEIYEKHLLKNEEKNVIFQNLNRTAEKIFGSKPFSHALGLIKTPSDITFIKNSASPLIKFDKNVLKSLNREIIKNNRSKITSYITDPETKKLINVFYKKFIKMIETASDFSAFSSLDSDENIDKEPKKLSVGKIIIDEDFNNLFTKYTNYGLKHAFFSEEDDLYIEEAEDLFKFGKNSPQLYSCNGFNHVDLIEPNTKIPTKILLKQEKNIKEGSINLTKFQAKISSETFFTELIKSLKNQYHRLIKAEYDDLNNIVYEKKHNAHILKIIALCVDIISETPLINQKLPIQYIHFSQGFKLLKNVVELVDKYVKSCEKCLTIKKDLNSIKAEIASHYNENNNHWKFFKNINPILTKKTIHLNHKFKRNNPLFSDKGYVMKARELWFDEQIKNMKIVISLLLNNPQLESSGIIKSLKLIIKDTNRIKRRQPSFEDFEDIASKIKTIYEEIKDLIPKSETNEDLKKILKIIDNFMNFDKYEYLYEDPSKIEIDGDFFHRIFTKIIRSERDISKIMFRTKEEDNYPIIKPEKIYKWKQNFNLKHIGLENTKINSWTECMKETKKPIFTNKVGDIVFDWKNVWHDHRHLNYLCHHVIKLDSEKKYLSSDHIENSKELVEWLKTKKFTPEMIKNNWKKDNETFLLTKYFIKKRNYSISSLKDINKIKQSLYEENILFRDFSKEDLIFDKFFEINGENEIEIKTPFDISEEFLDSYKDISVEMGVSENKAVEIHFLLHHLLQKPNFRKTNFEVFSKKIVLEKLEKLEEYETYSLQFLIPDRYRSKGTAYVGFNSCIVGHYTKGSEKNILRQIYLMIFLRVKSKTKTKEADNFYLLTSKFGLKTKNQFFPRKMTSNSKNWRIFQEYKDLTDSLIKICPPLPSEDNFWTSQIYDSNSNSIKNFTACYFNDGNQNEPPLNYMWLKFKQFFSAFDTDQDFFDLKTDARLLEDVGKILKLDAEIKNHNIEYQKIKTELVKNTELSKKIITQFKKTLTTDLKKLKKEELTNLSFFRKELMEKANVLPEKEKELNEKIKILAQTIKIKEEKKEKIKKFVENLGSEDYQSFIELVLNYKKFHNIETLNSNLITNLRTEMDDYEINLKHKIEKHKKKFKINTEKYKDGKLSKKPEKIFYISKNIKTPLLKKITSSFISLLYRKTETPFQQFLSDPLKSVMVSIKPNGKIILSVSCAVPFIRPTSYESKNKLGIDLGLREFLNYSVLEGDAENTSINSFKKINEVIDKMITKTKILSTSASTYQQKIDSTKFRNHPSYFDINYLNYKNKINLKEQAIADTSMRQSIEVIADYVRSKKIIPKKGISKHLNDNTACYIENLKGFQAKKGGKYSEAAARWLRGNFSKFLEEKSYLSGFAVRTVPAPYTSKLCSVCGKEGLKGYLVVISTTDHKGTSYEKTKDKLGYIKKNHKLLFAPTEPTTSNNITIPAFSDDGFKKGDLQIWDYKKILNKMNKNLILKEENGQHLVFIFSQSGIVFHCPDCKTYANRDINASVNIHSYNPIIYRAKVINLWVDREKQFPRKSQEKLKIQYYYLLKVLSEALSYKIKNVYVGLVNTENEYVKENENIFLSFENLSDNEFESLKDTLEKGKKYYYKSKQIKTFVKTFKELKEKIKDNTDQEKIRFQNIYDIIS